MIIGIDTSQEALSIALIRNGDILFSCLFNKKNSHDELLMPLIDYCFHAGGYAFEALKGVAVSVGPGSFTGLRIGMAAAKGIALAQGIPFIAVPTFDAMAFRFAQHLLPGQRATLATAIDARREDVYLAVFDISPTEFRVKVPACAVSVSEAAQLLDHQTYLAGNGAQKISDFMQENLHILPVQETICHAEAVALLGEQKLARGETSDLDSCEPLYLRDFHTTTPKPVNIPAQGLLKGE